MINYDHEDGVSVSASKVTSSVLTVRNATARHGGNYTCAPANARQSSIYVHVLKGLYSTTFRKPININQQKKIKQEHNNL